MLYGVGINDCPGWSNWRKLGKNHIYYRIYCLWNSMLSRCYNERYQKTHPTYKGCTVCDRWKYLSKFAEDVMSLPNFDLWRDNPNGRFCLDKDSLIKGNKVYYKDACQFLSNENNIKEAHTRYKVSDKVIKNIVSYGLSNSKRVLCTFKDGSTKEYPSVTEASRDGFDRSHIVGCCNGTRKTHKGCRFEFI